MTASLRKFLRLIPAPVAGGSRTLNLLHRGEQSRPAAERAAARKRWRERQPAREAAELVADRYQASDIELPGNSLTAPRQRARGPFRTRMPSRQAVMAAEDRGGRALKLNKST
jgi:hypothetical protein